MAGYSRQSSGLIVAAAGIKASHFNNEYNAIEAAFNATTGHTHSGAAGEGAPISLTASVAGVLPVANGGTNASTAAAARTSLGLVIGTDVQAYDAGLLSIAGLTTAADKMIYTTASDTYAVTSLTSFARTVLDDADAATARATLGVTIGTDVQAYDAALASISALGTTADRLLYTTAANTFAEATVTSFARTVLDDTDAATARATLGLVIGTNVQAYDAELAAIAGLTSAADTLPYFTGSGTASLATFTSFGRSLVDDASASAARTTLGLVIGTDVQAYDAELAAIAGLTSAADKLPYFTGAGTASVADFTAFGRTLVANADAAAARTDLGLEDSATQSVATLTATILPAGIMMQYGGVTAPTGWLACDGSAVSRTTYATLFAAISTTWGAGDGSTTFNLPDLRGRAAIGSGTGSGLTARTLGDTGGGETKALSIANLPTGNIGTLTLPSKYGSNLGGVNGWGKDVGSDGNEVENIVSAGSGTAFDVMNPYAVVQYIIKT